MTEWQDDEYEELPNHDGLHEGDLVRWPAQKVLGIIVQFVGVDNARLFCERFTCAQPMTQSLVALGTRDDRGVQVLSPEDRARHQRLHEQARSREGKAVLKRSRGKPHEIRGTAYGRANQVLWKESDDWYGVTSEGEALLPGSGHGSPDNRLPPMRLAIKRSSEWSPELAAFLGYWVMERERKAMGWLIARHELLAITMLHLHDADGRPRTYAHVATLLGTTESAVKDRVYRARKLLKARTGGPEDLEASYSAVAGKDIAS